jgi:hypothetical protein
MFPNTIHDNDCLHGAQGPKPVPSAYDKLLAQNEQLIQQNSELIAQLSQLCARVLALEANLREMLKPDPRAIILKN